MTKIEDAAIKAENMMNNKYGNTWFIVYSDDNGEEKIEVKDEYTEEYDKYYETFYFN